MAVQPDRVLTHMLLLLHASMPHPQRGSPAPPPALVSPPHPCRFTPAPRPAGTPIGEYLYSIKAEWDERAAAAAHATQRRATRDAASTYVNTRSEVCWGGWWWVVVSLCHTMCAFG